MPPRRAITNVDKLFCSVEGCENIVKAKGLCTKHHQRWYRSGKTDTKHIRDLLTNWVRCKTPGCENRGHPVLKYCPDCYEKTKGE